MLFFLFWAPLLHRISRLSISSNLENELPLLIGREKSNAGVCDLDLVSEGSVILVLASEAEESLLSLGTIPGLDSDTLNIIHLALRLQNLTCSTTVYGADHHKNVQNVQSDHESKPPHIL